MFTGSALHPTPCRCRHANMVIPCSPLIHSGHQCPAKHLHIQRALSSTLCLIDGYIPISCYRGCKPIMHTSEACHRDNSDAISTTAGTSLDRAWHNTTDRNYRVWAYCVLGCLFLHPLDYISRPTIMTSLKSLQNMLGPVPTGFCRLSALGSKLALPTQPTFWTPYRRCGGPIWMSRPSLTLTSKCSLVGKAVSYLGPCTPVGSRCVYETTWSRAVTCTIGNGLLSGYSSNPGGLT